MKFIAKNKIEISKELSDLDIFTLNFLKVINKYSPYVIISGYVSILLGRSRSSEDIDIIIPIIEKKDFKKIFSSLINNDFYCLNADSADDCYDYLKEKTAIRFAKTKTIIPNMELKFAKTKLDKMALNTSIAVHIKEDVINISNLELQIAFKEQYLKSDKDIEDAKHLREVAKDKLDLKKIKEYEAMVNEL